MSIYCSTFDLGLEHSPCCARLTKKGPKLYEVNDSKPCTCGSCPIEYKGSHVFPSDHDPRSGGLGLGAIPSHITRNGEDDAPEDGPWRPWLRVSVYSPSGTVLLTRKQVEELRDALTIWIDNSQTKRRADAQRKG